MDSVTIVELSRAAIALEKRERVTGYVDTLERLIREVEGENDIIQVRYPTGPKVYHYKCTDRAQVGDWVAVSNGDSNPQVLKVIGKGYHQAYGRNLTVHKKAIVVRRAHEGRFE